MLAVSPPWFSNFGWPLEDQELVLDHKLMWPSIEDVVPASPIYNISRETTVSSESLPHSSSSPPHGTKAQNNPYCVKKLSHNANERDRRKKLNTLYSSLRALLPESDRPSKLSIPATVSKVVKYIPELEKQVERLKKTKEEVLSKLSSPKQDVDQIHCNKRRRDHEPRVTPSSPSIVASQVGDKEVVIQICAAHLKNNLLSSVLQKLEDEGLQVLHASTFTTVGDTVFYTIHLKMKVAGGMDWGLLNEKLLSFCGCKSFGQNHRK